MELTIKDLQQYNTNLLRVVSQICEEEKIPYIGMFGTMLGAVRHKGTIPWDADVDIAVPVCMIDRFVRVMESRLPNEYWVDYRKNNKHKRLFPRIGLKQYETRVVHVDVYPLIGLPDSIEKQKHLFSNIQRVVRLATVKRYKYAGKKEIKAKIARLLSLTISEDRLMNWYDFLCNKYAYEDSQLIGCSNAASGYKRTYNKDDIEDTIMVEYEDFQIRIPRKYDLILTILYKDYMKYPPQNEIDNAINEKYIVNSL